MKLENTATLHIDLWETHEGNTPQMIAEQVKPPNAKERRWIPQSIADCIWLWFEFETPEEKEQFIKNLPENPALSVSTHFTQERIDHWTKS